MERNTMREYAEPAFYNSPPASSLPIPKFMSNGSDVRPSSGSKQPPLDAITHVEQVSPNTKQPSNRHDESNSVASDKFQDGIRVASANAVQGMPVDMVSFNPSTFSITSCLTHHVQKPNTTTTASPPRSIAFEKPVERTSYHSETPAKCEELLCQSPETLELWQRQQAIINGIDSNSTNALIGPAPQEMNPGFSPACDAGRSSTHEFTRSGTWKDKNGIEHAEFVLPGDSSLAAKTPKALSDGSEETGVEADSKMDEEMNGACGCDEAEGLEDEKEMVEEREDVLLYGPVEGPLQRIRTLDDLPGFLVSEST